MGIYQKGSGNNRNPIVRGIGGIEIEAIRSNIERKKHNYRVIGTGVIILILMRLVLF